VAEIKSVHSIFNGVLRQEGRSNTRGASASPGLEAKTSEEFRTVTWSKASEKLMDTLRSTGGGKTSAVYNFSFGCPSHTSLGQPWRRGGGAIEGGEISLGGAALK